MIDAATLQEAISLLESAGWAIVPATPTPTMLEEGWYGATAEDAAHTWNYMLDAAPKEAEIQGQSVALFLSGRTPKAD